MILTVGLFLLILFEDVYCEMRKLSIQENAELQNICGIADFNGTIKDTEFKTIYGIDARAGDFPWAVKIFMIHLSDRGATECTGSIISPWHIITAKHCIPQDITGVYAVIAGTTCVYDHLRKFIYKEELVECNSTTKGEMIIGKSYIVQKGYVGSDIKTSDSVDGDIGIIELNKSLSYEPVMKPICLPGIATKNIKIDDLLIVYGYGSTEITEEAKAKNITLASSKLKWVLARRCKDMSDFIHFEPLKKVIHLVEQYVMRFCPVFAQHLAHGDSGGGLEKIVGDRYILYGISSFATIFNVTEYQGVKRDYALRHQAFFDHMIVQKQVEFICYHTGICPNGYSIKNSSDGVGAIFGLLPVPKFFKLNNESNSQMVKTTKMITNFDKQKVNKNDTNIANERLQKPENSGTPYYDKYIILLTIIYTYIIGIN